MSKHYNAQPGFHTRRRQANYAGVAGGCAGVLEVIRACYRVTRANHRGRANPMVRHKHHLRDARKRLGADARRAGQRWFPDAGIQGLRCSSRRPTALRAGKPFQ